jgi:hypothetical protein
MTKNGVYNFAIANEEVTDLVEFTIDQFRKERRNIEINNIDFPTP